MRYILRGCHPSEESLQKLLNYMADRGWTYKATLSGLNDNIGWLTIMFEQPV